MTVAETDTSIYRRNVDLSAIDTAWRHFAFVYQHEARILSAFYNGVKVFERENFTCVAQDSYIRLGNGQFDELRISPVALYTEDFDPPTEPFTV